MAREAHLERLPSELYDEIFSSFSYVEDDLVLSRKDQFITEPLAWARSVLRPYQVVSTEELKSLRAVSKALYHPATRALCQKCFMVIGPFCNRTTDGSHKNILANDKNFVPNIRNLRIRLGSTENCRQEPKKVSNDALESVVEDLSSLEQREENPGVFSSFMSMLPRFLHKVENLERLIIMFDEEWQTDVRLSWSTAPKVHLSMIDELRQTVLGLFKSPSPYLETVTDLQLALPCTYDFTVVSEVIPSDLLNRLRHLRLQVVDATGAYGHRWYGNISYDEANIENSNLQEAYPNGDHSSGIQSIVRRCTNLKTLGVSVAQEVHLDLAAWTPNGGGLETLYLHRTTHTAEELIRIMSPAHDFRGADRLYAIWLEEVVLKSGTWLQVFTHLLARPSFSYLRVDNLGYDKHGASSHLWETPDYPTEESEHIWSLSKTDHTSLNRLVRHLIAKAGGQDLYPSEMNEQEPLEYWDSDAHSTDLDE